nr:MAG TPA: hypothetical protein [Caudoviricetes sp.]
MLSITFCCLFFSTCNYFRSCFFFIFNLPL